MCPRDHRGRKCEALRKPKDTGINLMRLFPSSWVGAGVFGVVGGEGLYVQALGNCVPLEGNSDMN